MMKKGITVFNSEVAANFIPQGSMSHSMLMILIQVDGEKHAIKLKDQKYLGEDKPQT